MFAKAKFDFVGAANQASFRKGDRVKVTFRGDPGGWSRGEVNGTEGFFPTDYVIYEAAEPKIGENTRCVHCFLILYPFLMNCLSQFHFFHLLMTDIPLPFSTTPKPTPAPATTQKIQVKAMFDYNADGKTIYLSSSLIHQVLFSPLRCHGIIISYW